MKIQLLTTLFLFTLALPALASRAPAVEDFVGIEVEETHFEPQGTEALFNFQKEMDQFEATKDRFAQATPQDSTSASDTLTFFTFGIILGLPGMIWLMMMNHLKNRAQIEAASNIEVLENYRKKREAASSAQSESRKVG